jgi:tetratricopeptide (TPR) repeat protein
MTRERDAWVPLAIFVGALAYLLPLRRYGVAVSDDGWYLVPVLRMLDGEILYRDVWTFYPPLEHHLLAWLFEATGPSIVASRTLLALAIATAAALSYRLARRAAPPALAWLPAALYAVAPGPWPKAFLGLCTALFFVALARAFEQPVPLRFAALGAVAGATLGLRQDLGVAQLATVLVAVPLPVWFPKGFPGAAPARLLPLAAAAFAGFAALVAPLAGYYALHGALRDLWEAVFVRALAQQSGAYPPVLPELLGLRAREGLAVALPMLAPPVLYAGFAVALAARLRREGMGAQGALQGALVAYAAATLSQAYHPVLLVRLLQSALPFYVLAAWAAAALHARAALRPTRRRIVAAAAAAAAAWLWLVLRGVADVHPGDLYTGSARVLRYDAPVEVLGDELLAGWGQAEEVRLLRAFYAAHTRPGEPTAALPTHPLYHALLDRPNPTRFLADHAHGNFTMSAAQKEVEAARLRESAARYVIAEQAWYATDGAHDPFRELLRREFRPVRSYVSVVVLERDASPDAQRLGAILRRTFAGQPTPEDLASLREVVRERPDEPLPWKLLGSVAAAFGETDEAIDAYRRAAALDPADASSLERSATLLLQAGRSREAAGDVQRARKVRASPTTRKLEAALAP